jgi:hypothetical protein
VTSQEQRGLNKVKASVFRRWLVIWAYSPGSNHRLTGGYDYYWSYMYSNTFSALLMSLYILEVPLSLLNFASLLFQDHSKLNLTC